MGVEIPTEGDKRRSMFVKIITNRDERQSAVVNLSQLKMSSAVNETRDSVYGALTSTEEDTTQSMGVKITTQGDKRRPIVVKIITTTVKETFGTEGDR